MNLVPPTSEEYANETTTEAEKSAVEYSQEHLALSDATWSVKNGMLEGLKAIRHELGLMHSHLVNKYGLIPSYISGAYTAIEDAEGFLKTIASGGELLTPVPKKPEIKEENKLQVNDTVKVPSNLKDVPYMQEWAGTLLFPKLRELTQRKDVEVDMRADEVKRKLQLRFSITVENQPAVLLPGGYKPNSIMDLVAIAKSIDAL